MKCLVTKLNGVVNNSELLKLGELRIDVLQEASLTGSTSNLVLQASKEIPIEIIGNGFFTDEGLTINKGKKLSINPNIPTAIYLSNGNYSIAIYDKYNLTSISVNKHGVKFDLSILKYLTNLQTINLSGTQITGDIQSLQNLTNLQTLRVNSTQVVGDIQSLKSLSLLSTLECFHTKIAGNISSLQYLTNLQIANLSSTQIMGDISNLQNLVNITFLRMDSLAVTGNISMLNKLTGLETFMCNGSKEVTGNFSSLQNLPKLKTCDLSNTKITGNTSSFNSLSKLEKLWLAGIDLTGNDVATLPDSLKYLQSNSNLSWSTRRSSAKIIGIEGNPRFTTVDKMLQDQAQCQIGYNPDDAPYIKLISVVGTRTSASDTAVQTLQSKGYTVTVTPE